ncbi:MAG: hypoxanthine phosphoribosyltransferase [Spirochaetia bacterium]|nr:hypoxanthine phosphoribosyltransferase [Spirochaetia bacterium]
MLENEKKKLPILISEEEIQEKIKKMGKEITLYYKDKISQSNPLVVIGVLKGAFIFMADLIRQINLPVIIDFIRLSSYGKDSKSSGSVKMMHKNTEKIIGKHVLIVEDIIDTALTLNFFMNDLKKEEASSVEVVALFLKKEKYKSEYKIKFTGFETKDKFLVGYGLDYNELYRNLPYVSYLENI